MKIGIAQLSYCALVAVVVGVVPACVWALDFPGPEPGTAAGKVAQGSAILENSVMAVGYSYSDGKVYLSRITDKMTSRILDMGSAELFQVQLADGTMVRSSDMSRVNRPILKNLKPSKKSVRLAERFAGKQLSVELASKDGNLRAVWRSTLRDGSNYVRQELILSAKSKSVPVKDIVLLDFSADGGRTVGKVDGSPAVIENTFLAVEHPLSSNTAIDGRVRCSLVRNSEINPGQPVNQSSVIGVVPDGQLRRGFLYYMERERAHPYRSFLHYNSWYDCTWGTDMSEKWILDVIQKFGTELVQKRHVRLDSIVMDDGWDDASSLIWDISKEKFPGGFKPLSSLAACFNTHLGIWISPCGVTGGMVQDRPAYAKAQGLGELTLTNPKYYNRFRTVCLDMISSFDANYFKWDTFNGESVSESDALFQVASELRKKSPHIFCNMTSGTWPSPFWLMHADSTWRGENDTGEAGEGSEREKWINYRDDVTHRLVVVRAPLYPLNSIMSHGILRGNMMLPATGEEGIEEFAHEVRSYFGSGTGLQELYISPKQMDSARWDIVAEAAKWSRNNTNVLVDSHWIGGDPAKGEVYGWSAWSKCKGIITLRNPSNKPAEINIDIAKAFELPKGAATVYRLKSPWVDDAGKPSVTVTSGKEYTIKLAPFEVLVLEGIPV